MDFLPEEISNYCELHSTPENDVLSKLNRETHAKFLYARMLSGHLQGQLLKMLSQMIKPKSILEIGTYTGYSALCMAEGLCENGKLHTIEKNVELEDVIRKYIALAGFENKIELYIGNAADIIPTLSTTFDLVFLDADKENYVKYFGLIIDKVSNGGFIIADNVLWSGKVLSPKENDAETKALALFNEHIKSDKRVENMILPFRDGLSIIRKLI